MKEGLVRMKKDKLNLTVPAIVFAVCAVAASALRILQYFTVVEPYRGFFTRFNFGIALFYALIAFSAIYFGVSFFIKRKSVGFDAAVSKRPVSGIASLLCGAGAFASVYGEYADMGKDVSAYAVTSASTGSNSGKVLVFAALIFGLCSAVFFIVYGVACITGKNNGSAYKLLALAPVMWSLSRLVLRFTRTVSYVRVSELLLEMLALCAYCIFFMAFARSVGSIESDSSKWKVAAFGFIGALFGIICFVPRLAALLAGHPELIYVLSRADISDLTTALFMLVTVFSRICKNTVLTDENGAPVDENAEPAAEEANETEK